MWEEEGSNSLFLPDQAARTSRPQDSPAAEGEDADAGFFQTKSVAARAKKPGNQLPFEKGTDVGKKGQTREKGTDTFFAV